MQLSFHRIFLLKLNITATADRINDIQIICSISLSNIMSHGIGLNCFGVIPTNLAPSKSIMNEIEKVRIKISILSFIVDFDCTCYSPAPFLSSLFNVQM